MGTTGISLLLDSLLQEAGLGFYLILLLLLLLYYYYHYYFYCYNYYYYYYYYPSCIYVPCKHVKA